MCSREISEDRMWRIWKNILIWLQYFFINIIKIGPMPRHVAFIMDGSRRYAEQKHITVVEGQTEGYHKLINTLNCCMDLGITELTMYTFSIENFKREKKEVDAFMQLAKEKFSYFLKIKDKLAKNGICVRIIGNFSIIPEDLRKIIIEVVLTTKNNNKIFLNLAFAYTSRDEITNAIKDIVKAVKHNEILCKDINEDMFSECLYTYNSSNPDLLIRTSGENRFSDFLMWQISNTCVYFTQVLWPDFTKWHFMRAIFYYQTCLNFQRVDGMQNSGPIAHNKRLSKFLKKLHHKRQVTIENMYLPKVQSHKKMNP